MTVVEYLDFEIEIGLGQGREYPLAVVRSPGGEARERMLFPFDELALASRLDKLQIALLRSGGKRRQTLSAEESTVQEFGQKLFDALLSGEIRSRYDVSQREAARRGLGLRIKLRIQAPELASLPWEFLYDARRAEYICLSTQTPLVRYIELPQVIQPLLITPPLRILGLLASPIGLALLDTENEKERVEQALKNLVDSGQVQIDWLEHANRRELQRTLRRGPWHILHFIGHGGFDPASDEGFIALETEHSELDRLPATQLARLLADHVSLRLAVMNSCDGAQGGQTDVFSSTASLLVRRGIPAVLAMQYEITDRAAIEFARGFYEALADDLPVDAATAEARKSVNLGLNNTFEWGTPVLFMRAPDGVLFKRPTPKELRDAAAQQAKREHLERQAVEPKIITTNVGSEVSGNIIFGNENQLQSQREAPARGQAQREAAEKAAREQTEHEIAEKAAFELAQGEAAAKATLKIVKPADRLAPAPQMPAPAPVKMTAPTPKKQPIPIWLKAVPLILIALALCSFGLWGLSTLASVMTAVKPTPMEKPLPVASVTQIFTPETPLTATLLAPTTRSITSTPAFTPAPTSLPVEISDSKGVSMRLVPAGDFTMGDKADDALVECQKFRSDCKREWFTDEEPAHTVFLDNFYMDVYEVTNAHYKACVDAGVCDTPANSNSNTHPSYYGNSAFDNYPVVSVDWFQSKTYCEWRKASLPTETEWEKAARGTDERTYPWGEGIDKDFANYVSNARDVIAIGSDESNKSPYGMYDMAGNALEWTADWYQAYPGNTVTDSINYGEKYRVLRGGSYGNYGYELRVSRRTRIIPDHSDYPIGFRCIATLK